MARFTVDQLRAALQGLEDDERDLIVSELRKKKADDPDMMARIEQIAAELAELKKGQQPPPPKKKTGLDAFLSALGL